MNKFQELKCFLMFRVAVRKANMAHAETGERYYVMPNMIPGQVSLVVTDRKNFRRLRSKGYASAEMKIEDVIRKCFYYTPYKDGTGMMEEERLKIKEVGYQLWYADRIVEARSERKAAKAKRKAVKKK